MDRKLRPARDQAAESDWQWNFDLQETKLREVTGNGISTSKRENAKITVYSLEG